MKDSTTDNVVSAHDKGVESAIAGWKIRRSPRTTTRVENMPLDMTRFRYQTTARKRGGDLVTVSAPKALADAGLDEFTDPNVNGGYLAMLLNPNLRLAKMTVPKVAVKSTQLARLKLISAAERLLDHLAAINDGRSTYVQWGIEPGSIEILLRGFYAGPREVELIVADTTMPVSIDTTGWFLFSGKVVGPVKPIRRGRLVEAQRFLDAITTQARTGRPNLDRWMADHVEAKRP